MSFVVVVVSETFFLPYGSFENPHVDIYLDS